VKERPILFNAAMVLALLEGRKTQTRRVVKPQPPANTLQVSTWHHPDSDDGRGHRFYAWADEPSDLHINADWCYPSPFGQAGDQLWVKETIVKVGFSGEHVYSAYKADEHLTVADAWPWKRDQLNSIHCPRGLSRIDLEVTGVRVERLNRISEDDCYAEGIDTEGAAYNEGENYVNAGSPVPAARWAYATLWDQINGRGPHHWNANPWVWVVEFERAKP